MAGADSGFVLYDAVVGGSVNTVLRCFQLPGQRRFSKSEIRKIGRERRSISLYPYPRSYSYASDLDWALTPFAITALGFL
jgi:hypothetical protein